MAPPPPAPPPPQPIPYSALRDATCNWHPLAVIGEGGFGTVYRGVITLGGVTVPVAIKRQAAGGGGVGGVGGPTGAATGGSGSSSSAAAPSSQQQQQQQHHHRQGGAEFDNEVALLRRLQHPNLVRLVGWCDPFAPSSSSLSPGVGGAGGSAGAGNNPFAASAYGSNANANANANGTSGRRGEGERCLVYELCAGGSLDDALRSGGSSSSSSPSSPPLHWRARLAVAAQAAQAVAALHGARPRAVCHGDIKPANVLLLLPDAARAAGGGGGRGDDGGGGAAAAGGVTAKLADVGLASELGGGQQQQHQQHQQHQQQRRPPGGGGGAAPPPPEEPQVRGDWAYLPPEARSRGCVGARSDAYALGVTLLQLATGAVERVHELPLRARLAAAGAAAGAGAEAAGGGGAGTAAGGGGLASLLDPRAGGWDVGAGEHLLRVALWLCSDREEERPRSVAAAAALLERLHSAAERAAERAARRERERAEALAEAWAGL